MNKIKKLGYGIIVYDDVCHLRNMIAEIRDLCDEIVVCLQNESYFGVPIEQKIVEYIGNIKEEGLIDDIIWFTPTQFHEEEGPNAPRFVEADKRNFILDFLENDSKCSHSMVIDSDEFYDHDDFENAKKIINDSDDIKVSYCEYINYYRDYQHLMVWPFRCYVPFITESKYRFDFKNGSFDKPSDPTRRYRIDEPNSKYVIFNFKVIKMHHLSWIRQDINFKIDNWSSKKFFDHDKGLKQKMLDRYNNYKDGQNAIIMFNTPYNEVIVNKLPKQYINPKNEITEI